MEVVHAPLLVVFLEVTMQARKRGWVSRWCFGVCGMRRYSTAALTRRELLDRIGNSLGVKEVFI